MARIYKMSDRINVKIDDVTITISPLSIDQKVEVTTLLMHGRLKGDIKAATLGTKLAVKYGIKAINGLTNSDDTPYKLEVDADGVTDECLNDLFNIEQSTKLTLICIALLNNGLPKVFTDENGNALEGVEVVPVETDGGDHSKN